MFKKSTLLVLIAFSCTKDNVTPLTLSKQEVTLHYDEKYQYSVKKGSKDLSASKVDWKINDETIGVISADGLFKARKVGTTFVNANYKGGLAQGDIVVKPRYQTFTEPLTNFNAKSSDVTYLETRKLLPVSSSIRLVYQGENSKVSSVIYTFKDNKIESIGVIFPPSVAVAEEVGAFYRERYPAFTVDDGEIIMLHDSRTYGLVLYATNSNIIALYLPYDPNERIKAGARFGSANEIMNTLKSQLVPE